VVYDKLVPPYVYKNTTRGYEKGGIAILEFFQSLLIGDNFWLFMIIGIFFVGILTSFNPCMYAMIPTIAGYAGLDETRKFRLTYLTGIFVLGFASTLSMYGFFGGLLVNQLEIIQHYWSKAAGVMFFLLALYLLGVVRLLFKLIPVKFIFFYQRRARREESLFAGKPLGAFILGLFFGFSPTPCTTPIVLAVLTYLVPKGELLFSSLLLFLYGIGHGIPLLIAANGFQWLERRLNLQLLGSWGKKIIGILLLGFAFYYLVIVANSNAHVH
jgi:cytochrome c-type biogenesis protein